MSFTLDPRLEADTHFIGDLPLCRVLLMDNALFSWLILVPRVADLIEIDDLAEPARARFWAEICAVTSMLKGVDAAHKMNVAMLGNEVRQLHAHIIARHQGDTAWPSPVWGKGGKRYGEAERGAMLDKVRIALVSSFQADRNNADGKRI